MTVDLAASAFNRHSQNGEDGILAALFNHLDVSSGFFVEFGAWDGPTLSNTYLLLTKGWSGCYIEGNDQRFGDLLRNVVEPNVSKIHRFVQPAGPDSLDAILEEVKAPVEFELLSIDIDSDDLAVWEGLNRYRPLCVVIEYNWTIPYDVEFRNPRGKNWGNAPRSIYAFAKGAGYRLVAVTATNLVFLDERSERDRATVSTVDLQSALPQLRFFFGYDGTFIRWAPGMSETDVAPEFYKVPWSNALVPQPIPKALRRYTDSSGRLSKFRRGSMVAASALTRPVAAIRELKVVVLAKKHR